MRVVLIVVLVTGLGARVHALDKKGARLSRAPQKDFNLSGFIFAGGFLYNPTYASRPNNTGLALFRFGLHLDLDFWGGLLTLSYDQNSFTDGSNDTSHPFLPSEHDHILGLASTIPLSPSWSLTPAVHYEIDVEGSGPSGIYRRTHPDCQPGSPPDCYQAGYSQSYLDAYLRLAYSGERSGAYVAFGGFLWNPTYAARPDNAGLALLRYSLHGETTLWRAIVLRLDFNSFTDEDESPFAPTELDVVGEIAFKWQNYEVRLNGEADLPLGLYPAQGAHPARPTPDLKQFYVALLLQWNFDLGERLAKQ